MNANALVIFDAATVNKVDAGRLPPNYVGVRQVRPENKSSKGDVDKIKSSKIEFTITDENGNAVRRMTKQEKKALKLKIKEETKRKRLEEKSEAIQKKKQRTSRRKQEKKPNRDRDGPKKTEKDDENQRDSQMKDLINAGLEIAKDEQEPLVPKEPISLPMMAAQDGGLREVENKFTLPAVLSSHLSIQALEMGSFSVGNNYQTHTQKTVTTVRYDEEQSKSWATSIKSSMSIAERVRDAEQGTRPMPYQIVPEVWRRLSAKESLTHNTKVEFTSQVPPSDPSSPPPPLAYSSIPSLPQSLLVSLREQNSSRDLSYDKATNAVCTLIHKATPFHMSCGAKFGCEFLLYDGPRGDRHSFGGLRVVLEMPSAYSLAGYVRCLNTAGKLALLATAELSEDGEVVVKIVDLALEKILSAPTHQRYSRTQARRDVGKNLDKRSES